MKKSILLVFLTSASVSMAWDFSSAWNNAVNYFSSSPAASADYLQSSSNSLRDKQKQMVIAAAIAAALSGTAARLFWPDSKETAKKKAENYAADIQIKMVKYLENMQGSISFSSAGTKVFSYGFPGFGGSYVVSYHVSKQKPLEISITNLRTGKRELYKAPLQISDNPVRVDLSSEGQLTKKKPTNDVTDDLYRGTTSSEVD